MKPLCPRQLSWRGGPAGAEGTLQTGEAALQSPITGNPEGAPEGIRCPRSGIGSPARAARLFANRCAWVECSETYMCNRQVHLFYFIFIFLQKAFLEHEIWELCAYFFSCIGISHAMQKEGKKPPTFSFCREGKDTRNSCNMHAAGVGGKPE